MIKTLLLTTALVVTTLNVANATSENDYNKAYCASIGGETEVRHTYKGKRYVSVDCETDKEVIEGGKDKRSSLDSVQQALFFNVLTGKTPVVVIYDTDGVEGIYEYRIRKVCEAMFITYRSVRVKW